MGESKVAAGIIARFNFWSKKLSDATSDQEMVTAKASLDRIRAEAEKASVTLEEAVNMESADPGNTAAAVPLVPVAGKGKKDAKQPKSVTEKEKVADRAAKVAAERAQGKVPGQTGKVKVTKPKTEKKMRPCLDGCGTDVPGNFKMGHDAKLKSLILKVERGEEAIAAIPEIAQDLIKFRKGDVEEEKDSKGKTISKTQLWVCVAAPVKFPGRPEMAITKRED